MITLSRIANRKLSDMEMQIHDLRDKLRAAEKRLAELSPLHCDFCGKSQHEVKKLIAGPKTFICDECTWKCIEIVEAKA